MTASNLISASELLQRSKETAFRLVDATFDLADPAYGRATYERGHIPGAVYFDLDQDLSAPVGEHGGRHPLPDLRELARKFGAAGIDQDTPVVVYDQAGAMYAARAWWLLKYMGHQNVRFLDGGLAAYSAAGGELTTEVPNGPSLTFDLAVHDEMLVDADYVKGVIADPSVVIVDARAPERYRGEVEPLDRKAGHVPSAVNMFYGASLADGRFRPVTELKELFAPALRAPEVIAYCGSGVSGAHLLLGMIEAGVRSPKLYAGSWSDWSSYDELPVAKGEGVDERV